MASCSVAVQVARQQYTFKRKKKEGNEFSLCGAISCGICNPRLVWEFFDRKAARANLWAGAGQD
jgi:hypothetical protein